MMRGVINYHRPCFKCVVYYIFVFGSSMGSNEYVCAAKPLFVVCASN